MQCLKPVILQGERIILKPLEFEHASALCDAVRDGEKFATLSGLQSAIRALSK